MRKKCHVTILMLGDWPFHTDITSMFIDEMNRGVQGIYQPFIIRSTYNLAVVKDFVRQAIFKQKADIILTVGELCSVAAKAVVDDIALEKKIIFIGVRDPLRLGLVKTLESPETSFTGVIREAPSLLTLSDYFLQFSFFVQVVLIPYAADNSYLYHQAMYIQQYLLNQGMSVIIEPIQPDPLDMMSAISRYTGRIQGIILLEGCYSNAIQEQIAYFCWEHSILLCGSGPHAIKNGAACALAGDFLPIVKAGYKQLRLMWESKVLASKLPVAVLRNNEQFYINIDMLLRIGVSALQIAKICQQPGVVVARTWTVPYQKYISCDDL